MLVLTALWENCEGSQNMLVLAKMEMSIYNSEYDYLNYLKENENKVNVCYD